MPVKWARRAPEDASWAIMGPSGELVRTISCEKEDDIFFSGRLES